MLPFTLVHGNKAKPICTAIRPSSKIWKVILQRNKAKLGRFSLALLPCTSVDIITVLIFILRKCEKGTTPLHARGGCCYHSKICTRFFAASPNEKNAQRRKSFYRFVKKKPRSRSKGCSFLILIFKIMNSGLRNPKRNLQIIEEATSTQHKRRQK